ncbi:Release factor glutamine methyltransferase [Alphaproteobacteria bacterium SO-S41]|nr:Release factor glutamine methyltransferase [Alphaproteobacteria bacterium SO-S41]
MTAPLWKASIRAAHEEIERFSMLFELTPEPSPQSVIVLTHPHEDDAVIEAYYAEAPDGDALTAILGRDVKVEALPDVDWVKLSQEGLPPVRAGRFFVYGAHDKGKAPSNTIALGIDAGVAFGTGHHETTTGCLMALDWMKRTGMAPSNALDLGCGTGVLALGADRLWRIPVMASDIDPQAIDVTRENLRLNGGQMRIRAVVAEGFAHPMIGAAAPYDLIIANILAGPLTQLAPGIRDHIAPGGRVVLSGLLRTQELLVLSFYRAFGFRLERRWRLGPWSVLLLAL